MCGNVLVASMCFLVIKSESGPRLEGPGARPGESGDCLINFGETTLSKTSMGSRPLRDILSVVDRGFTGGTSGRTSAGLGCAEGAAGLSTQYVRRLPPHALVDRFAFLLEDAVVKVIISAFPVY